MHYYCRKQHKNIKNSLLSKTLLSLCPSLCLLRLVLFKNFKRQTGPAILGEGRGAMALPLFCIAKIKNGNKGKSRKDFKAETIKRLSPRVKCYCFSHSRAPRIQKCFLPPNHGSRQYFPVFLGPSTLRFISPAPSKK